MIKKLISISLLVLLPVMLNATCIDHDAVALNGDALPPCGEAPDNGFGCRPPADLVGGSHAFDAFGPLIDRGIASAGADLAGVRLSRISITSINEGAVMINITGITGLLNILSASDLGNEMKNAGILKKGDGFAVNPLIFNFFGMEQLSPWADDFDCLHIPLKLPHFSCIDWSRYWDCGNHHDNGDNNTVPPVPEPATIIILGSCLIGLKGVHRRFKS